MKNKVLHFLILLLCMILLANSIYASDETTSTSDINNIEDNDMVLNSRMISKTGNDNIKYSPTNIVYASSNGNYSSNGTTSDNPTTFTKAISLLHDDDTVYLTSKSSSDDYTDTFININNAKNASRFTITADTSKSIYFGSLTIPSKYNITVNNIIFTGNKVITNKGTLNINNCTVTDNNDYSNRISTVIHNQNANLTINSSLFKNNIAYLSGVIYSNGSSNLSIYNSIFENNTAYHGGAITSYNGNLTIENTTFKSNNANIGAVIFSAGNNSSVNISKSSFMNNTATDYGGAIVGWYCNVTIDNSLFRYNKAKNMAGAIAVMACNFVQTSCTLEENIAENSSILYSANSNMIVNYNVFYNKNISNWIYLEDNKKVSFDINWWSHNSPDFKTITNGFIPDKWIYFRAVNTTDVIKVTAYVQDDVKLSHIPERLVTFDYDEANISYEKMNISSSISNQYTGLLDNLDVKIDNEVIGLNSKLDIPIIVDDIIADVDENVTINVKSNRLVNENISIYLNEELLADTQLTDGIARYEYRIPVDLSGSINNITVILDENDYHNRMAVSSKLTVRCDDENISRIITPLYAFNQTSLNEDLPSSYDSRDYGYITSVKSQKSSGSCWAFSSLATLEAAVKKYANLTYDFSENNFKNIMKRYSFTGDVKDEPDSGALGLDAISYLVNYFGPVYEKDDPYNEYSLTSSMYNSVIHVQDVYIPTYSTQEELIRKIKIGVYNQGAMSITYYSSQLSNVYNSNRKSSNHAVSIVGWDDNYSKNNFKDTQTNMTPPSNGAFIVKNSWGSSWGYDGYFYLSYYDMSLMSSSSRYFYTILMDNQDRYDHIYQYDCDAYMIASKAQGVWIKHNHIAEDDEAISAVGTYILNKSSYLVNIYVNNKLRYTQEGIVNITGYRTIQLDKQIAVSKDDRFTAEICIRSLESNYTSYVYQPKNTNLYHMKANQSMSKAYNGLIYLDNSNYDEIDVLKVYTKKTSQITNIYIDTASKLTINTNVTLKEKNGILTYTLIDENEEEIISMINVKQNMTNNIIIDKNIYKQGNYTIKTTFTIEDNYIIEENYTFDIEDEITINIAANKTQYTGTITIPVEVKGLADNVNSSLTLIENNHILQTIELTDNSCTFQIENYTAKEHLYIIRYNANKIYTEKTVNITINVIKRSLENTIDKLSSYYLDENITISGLLTSDNNKVSNQSVQFYVNKQYVTSNKTDSNGRYTFIYTTKVTGNNNITITTSQSDIYYSSNQSTTFTVNKYKTFININPIKNTIVGEDIEVNGRLTNSKDTLSNSYLTVEYDDLTYIIKTDENGQFNVNLNSKYIGSNSINITYNGDDNNEYATKTAEFNTTKHESIMTLYIDNLYVNEDAQITLTLNDEKNQPLTNSKITLSIDNKNVTLDTSNKTSITYKYRITREGQINIRAYYTGNLTQEETTKKMTVESQYRILNTTMPITINNTMPRVNENMSIKITLNDENNRKIINENVTVKINNKTSTYTTNENGTIITSYMLKNDESIVNITAEYYGNQTLKSSTNNNIANRYYKADMKLLTGSFNTRPGEVVKLIAHITDNHADINEGQLVFKLNGITLKDEDENPIKINIKEGLAILEYKIPDNLSARTHNLTAVYSSKNYNRTEQSTPMTIYKYETHIELNPTITIDDNIQIKAQVTDQNNRALNKQTAICIKINGRSYNLNTTTGSINYKFKQKLKNGYYNLTIISGENGKYLSSATYNMLIKANDTIKTNYTNNTLNTFDLTKSGQTSRNNVLSILTGSFNVKSGDVIKLIAHLSDDEIDINYGQLVFKLNGITLKDEDENPKKISIKEGLAILEYKIPDNLSARTHNLTAVYSSTKYQRIELSTPLTMNKLNTHIESKPVYANSEEIFIKAEIFDDNNNHINKQTAVTIKIDGKSYNMNNSDGIINFKVPLKLSKGIHQVTIISGNNGKYYSSRLYTAIVRI